MLSSSHAPSTIRDWRPAVGSITGGGLDRRLLRRSPCPAVVTDGDRGTRRSSCPAGRQVRRVV